MYKFTYFTYLAIIFTVTGLTSRVTAYYEAKNFDCGPYGFICEGKNKLRLCNDTNMFGPSFLCPTNTICNDDSNDVCENTINYIDPGLTRTLRCHRNERIADPSVPGCKGYILCIPNKNRFQGIKFKCSGSTIFNGLSRVCSSPKSYKCPLTNNVKTDLELFSDGNTRTPSKSDDSLNPAAPRPIDCKDYKFTLTQEDSPTRTAYFCPNRPSRGESVTRCTVFSNKFCITLERDEEDQFLSNFGTAYRRPRVRL